VANVKDLLHTTIHSDGPGINGQVKVIGEWEVNAPSASAKYMGSEAAAKSNSLESFEGVPTSN
jgi:hypothetical protein